MVDGQITDISMTGVGFVTTEDLEINAQTITIRANLPIAHFERALSVAAIIRSKNPLNEQTSTFVYGLEFPELLD